jgi:hypothetical protein
MVQRLYTVFLRVSNGTRRRVGAFFRDKADAKEERDALRKQGKHATVGRGPDHWRGPTPENLNDD